MSRMGRISPIGDLSSKRLQVALGAEELGYMFLLRRTLAILAAAVLVLAASSTLCCAAKSSTSRGKVSVPRKIILGSTVVQSRSFYRTSIPEDSLAGIRLGRPAKEILSRWGNPSRITVAGSDTQGPGGAVPMQPGPAYQPPVASPYNAGASLYGNPYAGLANGLNRAAGEAGLMNSPMPGGLPPLPGYTSPNAGMAQPQQGGAATSNLLSLEEVTWTYDLPNGITLEYIITDGLITQITVGGVGPWGLSRTRTGLQLGDTYKLVLWVCGYPESQKYAGRFLRVSYVNKSRALYTFLNRKLVGVTIAMVPQEIDQ